MIVMAEGRIQPAVKRLIDNELKKSDKACGANSIKLGSTKAVSVSVEKDQNARGTRDG